ncbi:MAG: hypothetical protein WCI63_04610 [bacterium]
MKNWKKYRQDEVVFHIKKKSYAYLTKIKLKYDLTLNKAFEKIVKEWVAFKNKEIREKKNGVYEKS